MARHPLNSTRRSVLTDLGSARYMIFGLGNAGLMMMTGFATALVVMHYNVTPMF